MANEGEAIVLRALEGVLEAAQRTGMLQLPAGKQPGDGLGTDGGSHQDGIEASPNGRSHATRVGRDADQETARSNGTGPEGAPKANAENTLTQIDAGREAPPRKLHGTAGPARDVLEPRALMTGGRTGLTPLGRTTGLHGSVGTDLGPPGGGHAVETTGTERPVPGRRPNKGPLARGRLASYAAGGAVGRIQSSEGEAQVTGAKSLALTRPAGLTALRGDGLGTAAAPVALGGLAGDELKPSGRSRGTATGRLHASQVLQGAPAGESSEEIRIDAVEIRHEGRELARRTLEDTSASGKRLITTVGGQSKPERVPGSEALSSRSALETLDLVGERRGGKCHGHAQDNERDRTGRGPGHEGGAERQSTEENPSGEEDGERQAAADGGAEQRAVEGKPLRGGTGPADLGTGAANGLAHRESTLLGIEEELIHLLDLRLEAADADRERLRLPGDGVDSLDEVLLEAVEEQENGLRLAQKVEAHLVAALEVVVEGHERLGHCLPVHDEGVMEGMPKTMDAEAFAFAVPDTLAELAKSGSINAQLLKVLEDLLVELRVDGLFGAQITEAVSETSDHGSGRRSIRRSSAPRSDTHRGLAQGGALAELLEGTGRTWSRSRGLAQLLIDVLNERSRIGRRIGG